MAPHCPPRPRRRKEALDPANNPRLACTSHWFALEAQVIVLTTEGGWTRSGSDLTTPRMIPPRSHASARGIPPLISRGGHGWESCRHYPSVGSSQVLINRSLAHARRAQTPALIIRSRAPHPHASRYGAATPLRQSCMYPPSGEGGGPPHVPSRMDIAMRAERWAASQTGPVFFT